MNDMSDRLAEEIAKIVPARDPLLQEREHTHGDYQRTADISQHLKRLFRHELHSENRVDVRHLESLDMIAVKLARILSGNPNVKDHWDDIAGYAKLGSEACV